MMKADQIAYYCATREDGDDLKRKLGLDNDAWVKDTVTAESWVWNKSNSKKKCINIASLQFNYQLGIEFEIIRYLSGPNWHFARLGDLLPKCFMSHVGIHLEDGEDFPKPPGLLVQETWTKEHTSEYLTTGKGAGRKYHYRIYEIAPATFIKYIKRIEPHAGA